MIALLLGLTLAAPFPLPAVDGKPLAVTKEQRSFRLPIRFERVKRFYVEQLGKTPEVSLVESSASGARVLTLTTRAKSESWKKAVIREAETETLIEVTPVLRLEEESILGTGRPLVEFIIGRSPEVQKAVQGINLTEEMRAK